MPRRYTRKTYKRTKASAKKSRSRFSLYKNRGSKAQARQIYALNKRVDRVYKTLSSDILHLPISETTMVTWGSSQSPTPGSITSFLLSSKFDTITNWKLRDVYLNLNLRFTYPACTYSSTQSATPNLYLRVVAFQYIKSAESEVDRADVLDCSGTSPDGIFSPFTFKVKSRVKILKDRRYKVDMNKSIAQPRFHLKKFVKYVQDSTQAVTKGDICFLMFAYNYGAEVTNWTNYGTNSYASVKYSLDIFYNTDLK